MQITLTVPDSVAERLERQATHLNKSIDELAYEIFNDGLGEDEDSEHDTEFQVDESDTFITEMEELVARIKATPVNPASIVLATQSLAEVEAVWQAMAKDPSAMAPDEWDRMWAEFEQQMKLQDRADDIAEGRA